MQGRMGLAKSDLIIRHADAHVQGPSGGFSLNSVRWVMILSLFKRSSGLTAARGLYGDIVRQARLPVFYGKEGGVADSEEVTGASNYSSVNQYSVTGSIGCVALAVRVLTRYGTEFVLAARARV